MLSVNMLSKQLADVNGRILATGQSGQSPNSIYDLRDRVINDLSKLVDLTVDYQDRGVANLRLGSSGVGPVLVEAQQHATSILKKQLVGFNLLFSLVEHADLQTRLLPEWLLVLLMRLRLRMKY